MPWLVAAMVVAFACGSSSVPSVLHAGHAARWVILGMLLVAAGARAVAVGRLLPAGAPAVAATSFVVLALVSAAWSVSPRLTAERAVSVAVLLAAAMLLVAAEAEPGRLLTGLVAGAALVAVAGLLLLVVDHSAAVQPASFESAVRFRGLGQDPNTAGLLFALALPIALGLAFRGDSLRSRAPYAAAVALFAGSIVASGSRGALFAGGVGALVVVAAGLAAPRARATTAAIVACTVGLGLLIQNVPKAHAAPPGTTRSVSVAGPPARPGYLNAEAFYPLDADVGGPLPGGGQPPLTRGFLGGSGRSAAWKGTVHQILQRPVLGFGFGTEAKVFVDRYYYFVGGSPEDSYLGIALQLGVVGLIALVALVASTLVGARRALAGPNRVLAATCAGAVAAGLTMALVQSYVYSAGDIGTATLWICAFLLAALGREATRA
jgi:O-antigen ligase/polysaccharide polymerase Wzy-like membrane protein